MYNNKFLLTSTFLLLLLFTITTSQQQFTSQPFSRTYPKPFAKVMDFNFQPQFNYTSQYVPVMYSGKRVSEKVRKSDIRWANIIGDENLPIPNTSENRTWNILRYEDGVFKKHKDQIKNDYHIGTEIIIFPKSLSPHSKGHLKVYNGEDSTKWMEIHAQEHVYTYVYMPLGYLHEVTAVKGTRTVATRKVETSRNVVQKEPKQEQIPNTEL